MTIYSVPNKVIFLSAMVALPLGFFLSANDHNGRGFVAALTVMGLVCLYAMLRDLASYAAFWAILAGLAILHVALIFLIPWPREIYFGVLATPLVVADIYLSAKVIILLVAPKNT